MKQMTRLVLCAIQWYTFVYWQMMYKYIMIYKRYTGEYIPYQTTIDHSDTIRCPDAQIGLIITKRNWFNILVEYEK